MKTFGFIIIRNDWLDTDPIVFEERKIYEIFLYVLLTKQIKL